MNTSASPAAYRCELDPDFDSLYEVEAAFQRLQAIEPVIVFLDTGKVLNRLIDTPSPFEPKQKKMDRNLPIIRAGTFVLPIIRCNENGHGIKVCQGRHRTYILSMLREVSIPFQTDRTMARAIQGEFGNDAGAGRFDVSKLTIPVVTTNEPG